MSLDSFRRPGLLWFLAATVLWLVAAAVDRRTDVVIENLGHHLRFAVAGTKLVIPDTITSVDHITIHAADSIDRPGAFFLEIDHDGASERRPVPRRFATSTGDPAPVGDWWVDHRDRPPSVLDESVRLDGPFTIRAVLRGRLSSELTISLDGQPTVHFSLRRGLLDNYLAIRRSDGSLLDVTTRDPPPGADLLATTAQILRAVAAACLVIAFVGLLATLMPDGLTVAKLSRAEGPSRNRSSHIALIASLGLAAIGAAISIWTAIIVLDGLPHQIDEVVYLLQASWLLDGDFAPAASTIQEHLRVPFTYLVDGRWIGHYPVGWPFLLSGGILVGTPHLVNPVLGAIFVVLVFLIGREIDDELTGLAAATLAVVSPLIRLLSASLFPHMACAVFVSLGLWLVLLARRRSEWWFGALAGLSMGCCLAVRPMTAVAVSLVLGGWMAIDASSARQPRTRWRTIGAAVCGGLLASIPTLAHNTAVTGNPLSLPYSLTRGSMYGLENLAFGIRNLDAILVSLSSSLFGWGWPVFVGGLALALPLAFVVVPFLLRRTKQEDLLLLIVVLVVALGHLPTRANGLHGYGARYAVDVAACLVILSARGFRELGRWAQPSRSAATAVVALFLALNLTALAALPSRLALYRGYYDVTGELERQLAATGIERAIILLEGDDWEPWGEAARLMTGPRRHEIIVGADLGNNSVIERAYPDRPVFRWDGRRLVRDDRGAD